MTEWEIAWRARASPWLIVHSILKVKNSNRLNVKAGLINDFLRKLRIRRLGWLEPNTKSVTASQVLLPRDHTSTPDTATSCYSGAVCFSNY